MFEIPKDATPEMIQFAKSVVAHLEERCLVGSQHFILQDGSGVRAIRMTYTDQIFNEVREALAEREEF